MTRHPTSPDVTITMNDGSVFRRSLVSGDFTQTHQLAPERFCNRQPWDYPPPSPSAPAIAQANASVEVLDLDL
jgi:hypothetical protein